MSWTEMYRWPFAPDDRPFIGLTIDKREVRCRFNPLKQQWHDDQGKAVVITHWRPIGEADRA